MNAMHDFPRVVVISISLFSCSSISLNSVICLLFEYKVLLPCMYRDNIVYSYFYDITNLQRMLYIIVDSSIKIVKKVFSFSAT